MDTLVQGVVAPEPEDVLATLSRRLGITTPPTYHMRDIPIDRLVVEGEDLLGRHGGQFSTNISLVGILHAPLVIRETGAEDTDEATTYRVIAGRRRVLGARRSGTPSVECRVYDELTPQMRALFILSENMHRSPAWIEELKALAELVSERVGLTDTELAKVLGISVAKIREQIKIVQLPRPLVEVIEAGEMSLSTAKQIVRLSKSQQARLSELAEGGGEITPEIVEQTLHHRIDQGLVPLQTVLAQEEPGAIQSQQDASPGQELDIASLVETLITWERTLTGRAGASKVCLFLKALRQEAALLQQQGLAAPKKG